MHGAHNQQVNQYIQTYIENQQLPTAPVTGPVVTRDIPPPPSARATACLEYPAKPDH